MDRKRSIEECEAELRQLQEENQQLRQSSSSFADLAERLMRSLERISSAAPWERGAARGRPVSPDPQPPLPGEED